MEKVPFIPPADEHTCSIRNV